MRSYLTIFLFIIFDLSAQDTNTTLLSTYDDLNTTDINATAADKNTSITIDEENYLDAFHKRATEQVKHWSGYTDDTLVTMEDYLLGEPDNNNTLKKDISKENKETVDSFFLNDKYLDQTNTSYVSIRPKADFSSKEKEEFNLKVSAHLALSKSMKRFNVFISELDKDNAEDIGADNTQDAKNAPEIGLNYFAPETYGIISKYSIGIRGIYPFVRARYSKEFHPGNWVIEPIQTLRYSAKDYFEEETQLYFDTKMTNTSLFRFYLSRGTESGTPGMSYNASVSMFFVPSKNTGLSLTQFANGSTQYQHSEDINAIPIVYEDYDGIYNYGTSVTFRQNFYRSWLFYELRPGINFHKQYDYEANYTLSAFLDIFFGKF